MVISHRPRTADGKGVVADGAGYCPCAAAGSAGGYGLGISGGAEPRTKQAQKDFPACGKGKPADV
jgi:hypothetical protein